MSSSSANYGTKRRSLRNKKRKQETISEVKDLTTSIEDTKAPSSWSKQILASVVKKDKTKRQLEYTSSNSLSHKKNFWNDHVRTKPKRKKEAIVTPSPAPSQYFSPSTTVSTDLLSSHSNTSRSSSSGSSSSYPLPEDVIDIDNYTTECSCSNKDLSELYLQTYSKEYYNYLFTKEETKIPTTAKPRTRHRAKLEFQFDNAPSDYMALQPFISKQMRAILVDWLIEVQEDLGLEDGTLHLAVRLLDRALSCTGDEGILIEKENLQCLGCACMSLSSRLNEVSPPSTDELESMSDKACTTPEIYAMALRVCTSLNFRLYTITPHHFTHRFLRACCLSIHNPVLDTMLNYLLQVALLHYELAVQTKPSLVTASALFLARVILGITSTTPSTNKYWSKTLQYYTTYTPGDLKATVKLIFAMHQKADENKYSGAFSKYSNEKFFRVALKMVILEEDLELAFSLDK